MKILDVVFAINTVKKQAVNINKNFPEKTSSLILTRDILLKDIPGANNIKLFAIVIGGWNLYVRHTTKPTGLLRSKMEQLEKCGYEVLLIHWEEWPTTQLLQNSYLKQRIDELLY